MAQLSLHTAQSQFQNKCALDTRLNRTQTAVWPLDDLRVEEWDQMVDTNIKGVLHGIGATLLVFRPQGSGHFVTTASTAAIRIVPSMAVYAGTRFAVRAICRLRRKPPG